MASNQNIDSNNDFWFSQEETPLDLNSLPDINQNEVTNNNGNSFFGNNDNIPNLDFPSLEGQATSEKEKEATE